MDQRVLMLVPDAGDAAFMCGVLSEAGVAYEPCADTADLFRKLRQGAGALLVAEEELTETANFELTEWLRQQPPWSDPPILLLSARGADSPVVRHALESLGNVTVLERPTRPPTLLSAVRSAIRSRNRQYQIGAHLAERERYAEALHEADRRKDEFLATLAHELRNPLAPMRTALEIMRIAPNDAAARGQAQGVLDRQLKQMARLIDDLLDLSRVSHGKLELKRERVSLRAVVESALEMTRPTMDAQTHMLEVHLPSDALSLDADPTRLSQVFANLLHNAAKFTERGGRISVRAFQDESAVHLEVTDNGVGIAAPDIPRVFEMFTQVGRSMEQSRGGLGVGLALSQALIRLHGGQIEARSDGPGKGSTFSVHLPFAPTAVNDTEHDSATRGHLTGRKVLVVDDNRDFADSLAATLRLAGNEVCVTYDGLEAVGIAGVWRPSVVLLDLGLPLLNGFDTARRIRDTAGKRNPLLIAITGWGQEEDRRRSRAAGFDHHLMKPVDPDVLTELIASELQTRAQHTHAGFI